VIFPIVYKQLLGLLMNSRSHIF